MLWLLSTLFSAAGLSGAVVLIIAGVVAAMWLRVPKVFILSGVAAGVAYLAIGGFARVVDDACMERVARQVAEIEARWVGLLEQVQIAHKQEVDLIEAGKVEAEASLIELQKDRDLIPIEQRCFLGTQEDVDAFNGRR